MIGDAVHICLHLAPMADTGSKNCSPSGGSSRVQRPSSQTEPMSTLPLVLTRRILAENPHDIIWRRLNASILASLMLPHSALLSEPPGREIE